MIWYAVCLSNEACVGEMGQMLTSCVYVEAQGTEVFFCHSASWRGCVPGSFCSSFTHCKSFEKREITGLVSESWGEERWNRLFKWNDFLYYFEKHGAFKIILARKLIFFFFPNSFSNKSLKCFYFFVFSSMLDKWLRSWWRGSYKTQLTSLGPRLSSSGFPVCYEH